MSLSDILVSATFLIEVLIVSGISDDLFVDEVVAKACERCLGRDGGWKKLKSSILWSNKSQISFDNVTALK